MGCRLSCFGHRYVDDEPLDPCWVDESPELPADYVKILDQGMFDKIKSNKTTQIWSITGSQDWSLIINDQLKILGIQLFLEKYNVKIERCHNPFRSINHVNMIPGESVDLTYIIHISEDYIPPHMDNPGTTPVFYRGRAAKTELCISCNENPSKLVILPCGHICLCSSCKNQYYSKRSTAKKTCPNCSAPIAKICSYSEVGLILESHMI